MIFKLLWRDELFHCLESPEWFGWIIPTLASWRRGLSCPGLVQSEGSSEIY